MNCQNFNKFKGKNVNCNVKIIIFKNLNEIIINPHYVY